MRGLELNHDGLRVPECSYGCSARMATSQLLPDLVLTICCEELLAIADAVELRNISRWAAHVIANDFLKVKPFVTTRWHYGGGNLSTWRTAMRQCLEAAARRGWDDSVWSHAALLLSVSCCAEFCECRVPEHCSYHNVWLPHEPCRALLVADLAAYLCVKTQMHRDVLGILAIFMVRCLQMMGHYWSVLLLLDDGNFAVVRIVAFVQGGRQWGGMDYYCAATPDEMGGWSIDAGGRLLMTMTSDLVDPDDPPLDFLYELDCMINDHTDLQTLHRRRARDGTAYTWRYFRKWYRSHDLALARWREAGPVL